MMLVLLRSKLPNDPDWRRGRFVSSRIKRQELHAFVKLRYSVPIVISLLGGEVVHQFHKHNG
jgi:hypothetical protein